MRGFIGIIINIIASLILAIRLKKYKFRENGEIEKAIKRKGRKLGILNINDKLPKIILFSFDGISSFFSFPVILGPVFLSSSRFSFSPFFFSKIRFIIYYIRFYIISIINRRYSSSFSYIKLSQ